MARVQQFAPERSGRAQCSNRALTESSRNAEAAIASSASITHQLVGCLDGYIGSTHRLVAQSPHIAELTESKEALAAATFDETSPRLSGKMVYTTASLTSMLLRVALEYGQT